MRLFRRIYDLLASDEYELKDRLMHIMTFVGGVTASVGMIVSCFQSSGWPVVLVIGLTVLVCGFCLLLSLKWKKHTLAGCLLIVLANFILFPACFFVAGGLNSGMIIWFVLGLIFCFLILRGLPFYIITAGSFIIAGITVMYSYYHPEYIVGSLYGKELHIDIVFSVLTVCVAIGCIFKYQTYTYERKNEELQQKEEELRAAMKEVQLASKAKGDFLANMSHEIRTPINAIVGMNEMILRESKNTEVMGYAGNIKSSSNTLLGIINDILDFSKIESGRMDIIPAEYDTQSMIADCYNTMFIRAKEKNLKYTFKIEPTLPTKLYGDELRIRQIVNNLLSNAVKYTYEGTVLTTFDEETYPGGKMSLIISVKDTGVGITDEDKQKLFEAFQRIEEKKNRSIEGTGLGLSITKQLVDLMNGELRVESEYGKGSEFKVILPQQIIDETAIGSMEMSFLQGRDISSYEYKESFHAPMASILMVDDVPMNLIVFKALLKTTEIQIDTALSGEEALRKVKEQRYDMIFMDHMMPEMDGIECLNKMKEIEHKNDGVPVIALTANAVAGVEEMYRAAGFDAYLSKPVKNEELEQMIMKHLPKDKYQITSVFSQESNLAE